jgi:hypothetical protein
MSCRVQLAVGKSCRNITIPCSQHQRSERLKQQHLEVHLLELGAPVQQQGGADVNVESRKVGSLADVSVPQTNDHWQWQLAHQQAVHPAEGKDDEVKLLALQMLNERFCKKVRSASTTERGSNATYHLSAVRLPSCETAPAKMSLVRDFAPTSPREVNERRRRRARCMPGCEGV